MKTKMELSRLNDIKHRVIGYYLNDKPIPFIMKKVNKSYTQIKRWIKKYQETKDITRRKPYKQRKRIINMHVASKLKRLIKKDCSLTYQEIANKVSEKTQVSKSTIGKYLKEHGSKYTLKPMIIISKNKSILKKHYEKKSIISKGGKKEKNRIRVKK